MQATILQKLEALQQEHRVKILFAAESGSRGWQFPSPDSDYDVRFVYIRHSHYYLSVCNQSFDLMFPISNELDILGWDLRKLLRLMMKSNTTPFEWLQSPVIYSNYPGFAEDLWELCQFYYSRRSNICHYLGIAAGARESISSGGIGIKKLFYLLRPLLAAKWCLERNTIAPMAIGPLMALLPGLIHQEVLHWITVKAGMPEGFEVTISRKLRDYIDQQMEYLDLASKQLPRDYFTADLLDGYFIKMLKIHDN